MRVNLDTMHSVFTSAVNAKDRDLQQLTSKEREALEIMVKALEEGKSAVVLNIKDKEFSHMEGKLDKPSSNIRSVVNRIFSVFQPGVQRLRDKLTVANVAVQDRSAALMDLPDVLSDPRVQELSKRQAESKEQNALQHELQESGLIYDRNTALKQLYARLLNCKDNDAMIKEIKDTKDAPKDSLQKTIKEEYRWISQTLEQELESVNTSVGSEKNINSLKKKLKFRFKQWADGTKLVEKRIKELRKQIDKNAVIVPKLKEKQEKPEKLLNPERLARKAGAPIPPSSPRPEYKTLAKMPDVGSKKRYDDFILNLKWDLYDLKADNTRPMDQKLAKTEKMITYIEGLKLEKEFESDAVLPSIRQTDVEALIRDWKNYKDELQGERM